MEVEWDDAKNRRNQKSHGVAFEEAQELFRSDRDYLELFDAAHSDTEERFVAIGPIKRGVVLIVWTERIEDTIRIISARWASPGEKSLYQKYMSGQHD